MEEFLDEKGRITTARKQEMRYYAKTLLFSFIIACCITIPFVIVEWVRTGHGVFLYYGDYNCQQLAFYRHCVDMVHSGNLNWDWYTDIGSSFVESYSYYLLGSPFFWVMCLFPSSFAPYLMGPMYIVKYVVAAVLAYAYLKRWVKNKDYAVLGALLYAFCGFQIYNTFFNQFHDVVALFPLLLIGMEEFIQNDRKGLFAVAVCLNALVNYFMFVGQVAFCVIYFLVRFSDRSFRVTVGKFIGLCLEAVLGLAMSAVLLVPAILGLMGNGRIEGSFSKLSDVLVYWKSGELYWQRYGQIFESYFFPPDIPSRVNFFHGHTERWASISGYIPMFGMTGVFAFFTTKRRNWLKAIIVFLIVCSFVPGLNSIFFLGRSAYYARWMYMMVMMFVLATILALECKETRWKGAIASCLVIMTAVFVPLGLLWYDRPDTDKTDYQLGRAPYLDRFWLYVLIGVAGVALTWYIVKRFRGTKVFSNCLLVATSACIVVYGCLHITNGKYHSHDSNFLVDQVLNGDVQLPSPEEDFYRIDLYRTSSISTLSNLNIFWHYPSMECFHTVVPPSLMDFYDLVSYRRSVNSHTDSSWYGLRALLSTQYSFIEDGKNKLKTAVVSLEDAESIAEYDASADWKLASEDEYTRTYTSQKFATEKGWTYYDTQNGFDIYSNDNYLPMGFSYTEFMTESEFKKISSGFQRSILLCTYLVVPDDMAEYYAQFMTEVKCDNRKSANYSVFSASVKERAETACTDFRWNSDGFSAKSSGEQSRIVFFSVPAEKGVFSGVLGSFAGGWTVKVNGEKAEALTVFSGLLAVEVPAGECEIEFSYLTNGFVLGCGITLVAVLFFVGYMLYWRRKKHRASYRFFDGDYYEESDTNMPKREKNAEEEATTTTEEATAEHPADESPMMDIPFTGEPPADVSSADVAPADVPAADVPPEEQV